MEKHEINDRKEFIKQKTGKEPEPEEKEVWFQKLEKDNLHVHKRIWVRE